MTRPLPRSYRPMLAALFAAFSILAVVGTSVLAPPALAQAVGDSPDEDVFDRFLSDPRDAESVSQTPVMDMETDDHGRLFMAYGVVDGVDGTASVEVVVRDAAMRWAKLASLSIDLPGGYGPGTIVKAVSVATVSKVGGRDDNNAGHVAAVFEQNGTDWLVYHSGSLKAPWTVLKPSALVLTGVPKKTVTDPAFIAPSMAVIPGERGKYDTYVAAIACVMPGSKAGDSAIKLVWMDFFSPGYFGPELYTVAGTGSTLMTGSFGRPSLTADVINGMWGVAFDNLAEPKVHVVSGRPGDQPSGMMRVFDTGAGDHHPALRAHNGEVNLVTLGRAKDGRAGAFEMKAYEGFLYNTAAFLVLGQVDDECRTPGDLDIRGTNVFTAASCYDDAGRKYRVTAFEFKRTSLQNTVTRVDDVAPFPVRQPRIAVAPVSATVGYHAVGFANERAFPVPGGVLGVASIVVDP